MQHTDPTLVLLFGPFDPSGSSNLPADAISCAALGGHAASVITAIHVQDTAGVEDVCTVSPEYIDEQSRCVLEDINVQAIKAGPLYSTDAVRVLANIVADYSHLPLVLQLGWPLEAAVPEDEDPEDTLAALFELVLPQTDLVVADHALLTHWQADGLLPGKAGRTPAQTLRSYGAKWVLTTGASVRTGQSGHFLLGPEQATFTWLSQPPTARLIDADGPLTCAVILELARGRPMPQAVEQAVKNANRLSTHSFQPGMGNRVINRSFHG